MCVLLFFGKYNSKGGYKILSSKRGTIKHLKNNKYKAVWYFPDNTSVSKTFDTKIASENWLDIQRALYGNEIYQDRILTLNIVYEKKYFPSRLQDIQLKSVKNQTIDRENQTFRNHLENSKIGNTLLKDLTVDNLNNFLIDKLTKENLSYSTVYKHIFQLLHSLLEYSFDRQWLKAPLHKQLKKPSKEVKPAKEITPYTPEQYKKLYLSSMELWDKLKQGRANLGYLLLFQTGLRTGELLALRWENVDMDKRIIYIKDNLAPHKDFETGKRSLEIDTPKTKCSKRQIGLNILSYQLLQEIQARNAESSITSPYVICNQKGDFLNPSSFRRYAQRLCNYANVPLINSLLHSSRHYFSTQCQENGISADDTGKALGQTNIKTTAIYTHLNEEKYAKKMQEYNFDKDLYDTQVERKSKKNNIINLNDFFTA